MTALNKEDIVKIYRQKSLEKGRPLKIGEFKRDGDLPSLNTLYRLFKNIHELRKKAEIKLIKVCYDERNDRFILSQKDEEISDEQFCKECFNNPETCGKDVKECKKELVNFE